jgi:hypothetical protein
LSAGPAGASRPAGVATAIRRCLTSAAVALVSLPLALGCDLGEAAKDPAQGPPLRVLSTYPVDGQGTECTAQSPPDCGVPINTTIELRFNRYLDPGTAVRQAISLYTGNPDQNRVFELEPEYDVIERVLVYRFRGSFRLEPRTLYRVELIEPTDESADGLRAFDQAPLEPGPVPLAFSFLTGDHEAPEAAPSSVPTCNQILTKMYRDNAGCSIEGCHNATESRMGLDLISQNGLLATAIDRVAHQTDLGPTADVVLQNPSRFGVNMARIRRAAPESSYLLYKLLVNPRNFASSPGEEESVHAVALPDGAGIAPDAQETERLREWFVRGEPMPIARTDDPEGQIAKGFARSELRELATWIRAGAPCP